MPTYQYRCSECGHDLEVVQKFSDAALTECPNCAGPLRKVYNAVGVVFKGSGFYSTDNRSNGAKVSNGSSNGSGSGSESKTSAPESGTSSGSGSSATTSSAPAKAAAD